MKLTTLTWIALCLGALPASIRTCRTCCCSSALLAGGGWTASHTHSRVVSMTPANSAGATGPFLQSSNRDKHHKMQPGGPQAWAACSSDQATKTLCQQDDQALAKQYLTTSACGLSLQIAICCPSDTRRMGLPNRDCAEQSENVLQRTQAGEQ